jgi:hypothetical protein
MSKKGKKKSTKRSIDWRQTLVGALVDLIIGLVLLLIAKLMK